MPLNPPPSTRIQMQFVGTTDQKADGWTENFYSNLSPAAAAVQFATSPFQLGPRLRMLTPDFRISKIKAVAIGNPADTQTQIYGPTLATGQFPMATAPATSGLPPWNAIQCNFVPTVGRSRRFALRGIPPVALVDTFRISTNPSWALAFSQWATAWGVSTIGNRQINYLSPLLPLTTILSANGKQLTFTFAAALPSWAVRGAIVRVRGVIGCNGLNHLWRIQDQLSTTSFVTYPMRRTTYGTPAGPIAIDQVVFSYAPITQIQGVRGMNRKTGRPPELLRGRALVRSA